MTVLITILIILLVLETIWGFAVLRGWEKTLEDWKKYSKEQEELYDQLWKDHLNLIKRVAEVKKDA